MLERLPPRLQPWWNLSVLAGQLHSVDHALILGVLDVECAGGEALRPKGAGGTGDWMPRHWSRYASRPAAATRFRHWRPSAEEYERTFKKKLEPNQVVPEICMPADVFGWGRGLMQIDYADPENEAFLAELMPDGTPAWKSAWKNIEYGTKKLSALIQFFHGDEFLAAASYNADVHAVQRALLSVSTPASDDRRHQAADRCTTHGRYASDVIGRRRHFQTLLSIPQDAQGDI